MRAGRSTLGQVPEGLFATGLVTRDVGLSPSACCPPSRPGVRPKRPVVSSVRAEGLAEHRRSRVAFVTHVSAGPGTSRRSCGRTDPDEATHGSLQLMATRARVSQWHVAQVWEREAAG